MVLQATGSVIDPSTGVAQPWLFSRGRWTQAHYNTIHDFYSPSASASAARAKTARQAQRAPAGASRGAMHAAEVTQRAMPGWGLGNVNATTLKTAAAVSCMVAAIVMYNRTVANTATRATATDG